MFVYFSCTLRRNINKGIITIVIKIPNITNIIINIIIIFTTIIITIIIIIDIIIIIIIIIIPPYSCVHQMFWIGVFFGPCSSSPLREPRNLRGIFAGCELFPVVLLYGVDLVRSFQALKFSNVLRCLWVLLPGLRSLLALLLPLFPKSFYFDFQVLVLSDLFHFFLIDSDISWHCHINQPHLLLFNHCYIWYVMGQMFVYLNFKVPENFDFFILQHFLNIVFPPFSDAGRWYFLHRFQCSIEATLLWRSL